MEGEAEGGVCVDAKKKVEDTVWYKGVDVIEGNVVENEVFKGRKDDPGGEWKGDGCVEGEIWTEVDIVWVGREAEIEGVSGCVEEGNEDGDSVRIAGDVLENVGNE